MQGTSKTRIRERKQSGKRLEIYNNGETSMIHTEVSLLFKSYNVIWGAVDNFAKFLNLVTDICKRNGIKKLVWSTNKTERINHLNGCNMTVHRDYANKSCPGEYLYSRHGQIAAEVNKRLGTDSASDSRTDLEKLIDARIEKMLAGKDTKPSDWAKKELAEAVAAGITDGTRPGGYATREQVAAMVLRATRK